jgi:hypothetical protein
MLAGKAEGRSGKASPSGRQETGIINNLSNLRVTLTSVKAKAVSEAICTGGDKSTAG